MADVNTTTTNQVIEYTAVANEPIPLGTQGENLVRRIVFDISDWESDYGVNGIIMLLHQRQHDSVPYTVTSFTRSNGKVYWDVTSEDTATPLQYGTVDLRYYIDTKLVKSQKYQTVVVSDHYGNALLEYLDPKQSWVNNVANMTYIADTARASALASEEAAAESAASAKQDAAFAGSDAEIARNASSSANISAINAADSASAAKTSQESAATSAESAKEFALSARSDAVAARQSETNAAVSEAHAVEVAESIPEDYTKVSNNLDSSIHETRDVVEQISAQQIAIMQSGSGLITVPFQWLNGEWRSSSGVYGNPLYANNAKTICSVPQAAQKQTLLFSPLNGYKYLIVLFTEDSKYNSYTPTIYTEESLSISFGDKYAYYAIEVRRTDDSDLTIDDISNEPVIVTAKIEKSVPDDYTATVEKVNSSIRETRDVVEQISAQQIAIMQSGGGSITIPFQWLNGEFRNSDGVYDAPVNANYKKTICSVPQATKGQKLKFTPGNNYKYLVVLFNEDGAFSTYNPRIYTEETLQYSFDDKYAYYAIEVRRTDDSDLTIDDIDSVPVIVTAEIEKSDTKENIIVLTEDIKDPIILTSDTIIYGNGKAIDIGIRILNDLSTFSNGFASIQYEVERESTIYNVFVSKTLGLESTQNYKHNRICIYAKSKDSINDSILLTPYLNEQDVIANNFSFTYSGSSFLIHIDDTTPFSEIVMCNDNINTWCLRTNGFNVKVYDTKFLFSGNSCVLVKDSNYDFRNCEFGYSMSNCGLEVQYGSGDVSNCLAHHVAGDGFNYHFGYNNKMFACTAAYCGDDGVSHHEEETLFYISGGEFHHCGKGGIASPAAGSFGEIHDVYCHDNPYGILAPFRHSSGEWQKHYVMVYNSILENNNIGIHSSYFMKTINCKFSGNDTNTSTKSSVYGNGEIINY